MSEIEVRLRHGFTTDNVMGQMFDAQLAVDGVVYGPEYEGLFCALPADIASFLSLSPIEEVMSTLEALVNENIIQMPTVNGVQFVYVSPGAR
jgi:hypothetical protein